MEREVAAMIVDPEIASVDDGVVTGIATSVFGKITPYVLHIILLD